MKKRAIEKLNRKLIKSAVLAMLSAAAVAVAAVPTGTVTTALAEEAVERAVAENAAIDIYDYAAGTELSSGVYYLSATKTFSASGKNGLRIKSGATVYLYIPEGVTLTATGANGSGTAGGKAGILVPSSATLILLGEGSVEANGGRAANGSSGGSGTSSSYVSGGTSRFGGSGGGGNGGGGAGAGIGTNGGTGGYGGGSARSSFSVETSAFKDDSGWEISGNRYPLSNRHGRDGANGSSSSSMGTLYVGAELTLTAKGGSARNSSASGGSAGSGSCVKDGDSERAIAGGAGGGGGGGGLSGANIGTGGGGGGQGGSGGMAGYIWSRYYIGGGGGGGGGGANGGYGGAQGQWSTVNSDKSGALYSSGSGGTYPGSSRYGGSGGVGVDGYVAASSDGTKTRDQGGNGGDGGDAGSYSTSKSALILGTDEAGAYTPYKYTVTFNGATESVDAPKVQTYEYGVKTPIVIPDYETTGTQILLGWQAATYGLHGNCFNATDETIYRPGEVIYIDGYLSGDIVLEAVFVELQGVSASSEMMETASGSFSEDVETEYFNYEVETKVDGVAADVGDLTLVAEDNSASVDVSYTGGKYQYVSPMDTMFRVFYNGEDTGEVTTAASAAALQFYGITITTHVDDVPSAVPGTVTLEGADAPVLTSETGSGIYTALSRENTTAYRVQVGGETAKELVLNNTTATGSALTFGNSAVVEYYTTTVTVEGNGTVDSVMLKANDGSAAYDLAKVSGNNYAVVLPKQEVSCTLYVNGMITEYDDIVLNQKNEITIYYYTTTVQTYLDNELADIGTVYVGAERATQAAMGVYTVNHLGTVETVTESLTVSGRRIKDGTESFVTHGTTENVRYYSAVYDAMGVEITDGTLPVDEKVYLPGDSVSVLSAIKSLEPAYTFDSWSVKGTPVALAETVIMGNETMQVQAVYKETEFSILYDPAVLGVVNTNPKNYTVSTETFTLAEPTAAGYTFLGWTWEADGLGIGSEAQETPVKEVTIEKGTTGNMMLLANWEEMTFTVALDILDLSDYEEEDRNTMCSLDFGTLLTGYTEEMIPQAVTFNVINSGNQNMTLTSWEQDNSNFVISGFNSSVELAPGERQEMTIRPAADLAEGNHDVFLTVNATGTGAYDDRTSSVMARIIITIGPDTRRPQLSITLDEEEWDVVQIDAMPLEIGEDYEGEEIKILNEDYTLFNTAQTLEITASDAESGVDAIYYHISDKKLNEKEVGVLSQTATGSALIWTEYDTDNKPVLEDCGPVYIYAMVFDRAAEPNQMMVSTDGVIVDTKAPVAKFTDAEETEVENNGSYAGTREVVVTDSWLESVTVDGAAMTIAEDGTCTFTVYPVSDEALEQPEVANSAPEGRVYEIICTDQMGNTNTLSITITNKEYEISFDLTEIKDSYEETMASITAYELTKRELPGLSAEFTPLEGRELLGWAIGSNDSETVVLVGESFEFTEDTTVYAVWSCIPYDINYELNGGSNAAQNPATYTKESKDVILSAPKKDGYAFIGWTWEAGFGIGAEAQTEPLLAIRIATGNIGDKTFVANWAEDSDGDGIADNEDPYPDDYDNDGIPDDEDFYPQDKDNDGIPDAEETDSDGDGIPDKDDVYPYDRDNDGIPDDEDFYPEDYDNDGIPDAEDEYPYDSDNDGVPDNVDTLPNDRDNDGIPDDEDEFPYDWDNDGIPDAEDEYPYDPENNNFADNPEKDSDGDGIPDAEDKYPFDRDNDGIPDMADKYPDDYDNDGIPDSLDALPNDRDNDGIPDELDAYPDDWDNDGIPDAVDKYPYDPANGKLSDSLELDSDGDGIPNAADKYPFDRDNDSIPDIADKNPDSFDELPGVSAPEVSPEDSDGDGIPNELDKYPNDYDNDGIEDSMDRYPKDFDNDGIPDIADKFPKDYDNDGIPDAYDKNPGVPDVMDPSEPDSDNDGIPDSLDKYPEDHDNDGIPDEADKYPDDYDNDGIDDAADLYPYDRDNDGIPDEADKYPDDYDNDGIPDNLDALPNDSENGGDMTDSDGDGIPDAADKYPNDYDNDGIPDDLDALPDDSDNDGIPDDEDLYPNDFDNDGIPDELDRYPYDPTNSNFGGDTSLDSDGDGIPDVEDEYPYDRDNDGIPDIADKNPDSYDELPDPIESTGMPKDSDGDGIPDIFDKYPYDRDNDGIPDTADKYPDDYDNDGIPDAEDEYPKDFDNDGIPDFKDSYPEDYDNDGIPDKFDKYPEDASNNGATDYVTDSDGDGIPDCADKYPEDYDNDGIPDAEDKYPDDYDNDGIPDDEDNYPEDYDNDGIPDKFDKYPKDENNDGLYTVVVNSGAGSGEFLPYTEVEVYADEATDASEFIEWKVVSGSVTLTATGSALTTFIMPEEDVEITAIYEEIPEEERYYAVTISTSAGGTATASALQIELSADDEEETKTASGSALSFTEYNERTGEVKLRAKPGTKILLEAIPDAGYSFEAWRILQGEITISEDSFVMPIGDVKLYAAFKSETGDGDEDDDDGTEEEENKENIKRLKEVEKLFDAYMDKMSVSNTTSKSTIKRRLNDLLETLQYDDVIVTIENYEKTKATYRETGKITATICISIGGEELEMEMEVVIKKLTSDGGSSGGYYPVATPTPTVTPAPTATPVPTATPIPGVIVVETTGENITDKSGNSVTGLVQTVGTTNQLTVPGITDSGNVESVDWSSSNPEVAEVDENGNIVMKQPGMTEIVVTAGEGTDKKTEVIVVVVEEEPPILNDPAEAVKYVKLGTSAADTPAVRTLMAGESEDINFWGVKNWKKEHYEYEWSSSDETVAVTDSVGVVTALNPGVTTLSLGLRNKATGKLLCVKNIDIVVPGDASNPIKLGTNKHNTFEKVSMKRNERIDLNFYGVQNWKKEDYIYIWKSSDPTVVWVNEVGMLTPVTEGTATINLILIHKGTGEPMYVTPVDVSVGKNN